MTDYTRGCQEFFLIMCQKEFSRFFTNANLGSQNITKNFLAWGGGVTFFPKARPKPSFSDLFDVLLFEDSPANKD
jgi:hypothetical protein